MNSVELAALHARCFETPRSWNATELEALLSSKGVFLCQHKYGFALGRIAGPEAELLTLAIDPAARRQGHARTLMATFETTTATNGAEEIFLEVSAQNTPAGALYQSLGFIQAGLRKNYYKTQSGTWIDAVVMRKQI